MPWIALKEISEIYLKEIAVLESSLQGVKSNANLKKFWHGGHDIVAGKVAYKMNFLRETQRPLGEATWKFETKNLAVRSPCKKKSAAFLASRPYEWG